MVMGSTNMGGAQMFILNLLQNMDLDRFQVDFAVSFEEREGGIGDELQSMGCHIYKLPYFKVYNYHHVSVTWHSFLEEHHYDIVHGHSTNSAFIYLKIAKKMGCVTIAHCHSAGFRGNMMQRLFKTYFSKKIRWVADYWFACSDIAAEHLYGKDYRHYKNYYNIPNAINAESYLYNEETAKRIRNGIGIGNDTFLCGHVGSFSGPKNHIFLLSVFNEVLKRRPDAKLVCCGEGYLMRQIKEKAEALGLMDKVIFAGVVRNCNEYMMAMDVMIFPSLFEGFPMAVIEAEATGLPIVISDVITKEVDLTDGVWRMSLSESPTEWARVACGLKIASRKEYNSIIGNSEYNMRTNARTVTSLYEDMVKCR